MRSVRYGAVGCAVGVALTALSAITLSARASVPAGFERNVSDTGDWHGGEPEIAVNPENPKNVVMVWPEQDATGVYRDPVTGTYDVAAGTAGYAADGAASRCGLGVSDDGGATWERTVLPGQMADSTLCSDAAVAAGPDGTFYAAFITFNQPTNPLPLVPPGTLPHVANDQPGQGSADTVIRSTDGGRTWSFPPVDAVGNRRDDAGRYAPGTNPETGGEGTSDRPWIAVDQTTGTVYVTAMSDLIQFNGTTKNENWVSASSDQARSFGTIYPVDDAAFPQTASASIAAAHGVLAVAYVGQQAPDSTNVLVLATSTDKGATFERHVLHAPVPTSFPVGVNLVADATRAGHYVVMLPTTGETGVLVYRTADNGVTWSAGVPVAVGSNRPWLAVSPDGTSIGVMGRDVHADGSQDVLAAFSHDRGATFTAPVRANRETTPKPPPGAVGLYDDVSWITMTNRFAYLGWGDWRPTPNNPNGENNAWMARLPLSSGG